MQNQIGSFHVIRAIPEEDCPGWQCFEVKEPGTGNLLMAQVRTLADQTQAVAAERMRVLHTLRDLRAPGLFRILDAGCLQEGPQYLVREPHRGRSLVEVLGPQSQKLEPELVRPLARQLAETLSQLHSRGLFGVSLCMERIWLTEDQRALLSVCETTHTVGSAGCPPVRTVVDAPVQKPTASVLYMAPEQCGVVEGPELSDRVDVYALGAVLYHVLSGRPPFTGQWTRDVLEGHLIKTPRPLLRLQPSVPEPLAQLVHRMLAKAPAQRPSIAEVSRELAVQCGEKVPPVPAPPQAMKTMPLGPTPSPAPPRRALTRMQPGDSIDRFRLVRCLGTGGFAEVFEAVDTNLQSGQRVAIKILLPEYAQNKQLLTRFFDELRATHLIRDPGIVHIYDCQVRDDGLPIITMEYLEGPTLAQEIHRTKRVFPLRAIRITHQVASTMATAHARGIVHRDLKPENLILVRDPLMPGGERAKVLDFGLAKIRDVAAGTLRIGTQPGSILGTPRYMAPEQRRDSSNVNDRADVYALGVLLFEMLEGDVPQLPAIAHAAMQRGPYMPRSSLPREVRCVPASVQALLERMLSLDPVHRPSMAEVTARLGEELARGLSGSPLPRRLLLAGGLAAAAGVLSAMAMSGGPLQRMRAAFGVTWELTTDKPGAEIRAEDGLLLGYTPWIIDPLRELEQGYAQDPMNVTVSLPGFEEQILTLHLYESTKRHIQLKPVLWNITSEPSGARVIGPGNRELGTTPWQGTPEGRRGSMKVRVVRDGYLPSEVTLPSQRSQRYEIQLKAAPPAPATPEMNPQKRSPQRRQPASPFRSFKRAPAAPASVAEPPVKITDI